MCLNRAIDASEVGRTDGNLVALSDTRVRARWVDRCGNDDLYRLTSENSASRSLSYTYDDTGNRLSMSAAPGVTTTYGYPETSHRQTAVGSTPRSFDENGNLRLLNQSSRSSDQN